MSAVEGAIQASIARAQQPGTPPRLAEALHYAVFPGGARVRPALCMAVAGACDDDGPVAAAAAAAIELLHCASLVHDDLPCFDNAPLRRGKASVHRKYGEPLAVLVGDALIVMAFESITHGAAKCPEKLAPLLGILHRAAGAPHGLVAGQAWECEPSPRLDQYHRAKTGALFVASTVAGATAAGADPEPWRSVGERLGRAYQIADDLRDVLAAPQELGKPSLQDRALGRPSAVEEHGVDGAMTALRTLLADAVAAIPPCAGADRLRRLVLKQAERLSPKGVSQSAA